MSPGIVLRIPLGGVENLLYKQIHLLSVLKQDVAALIKIGLVSGYLWLDLTYSCLLS